MRLFTLHISLFSLSLHHTLPTLSTSNPNAASNDSFLIPLPRRTEQRHCLRTQITHFPSFLIPLLKQCIICDASVSFLISLFTFHFHLILSKTTAHCLRHEITFHFTFVERPSFSNGQKYHFPSYLSLPHSQQYSSAWCRWSSTTATKFQNAQQLNKSMFFFKNSKKTFQKNIIPQLRCNLSPQKFTKKYFSKKTLKLKQKPNPTHCHSSRRC